MLEPSAWLGCLPFFILLFILLFTKRGMLTASCLFLLSTAALASLVWLTFPAVLLGAFLKGLLTSLDIALIIVGSLLFLDVLKKTHILSSLTHYLHELVPDSRVQALLLAWLFGALIEGTAGFGTPAAVVAPLLVHLGLRPLTAVGLSLLANTVPVSYGAVGTPLRIGMNSLPISEVSRLSGWIGAWLSLILPFLLANYLNREISSRQGIIGPHGMSHAPGQEGASTPSSIYPFAFWSGLVFAIPYLFASRLGSEFPTVIGATTGLGLTFALGKQRWWRNLFFPKITQRLSLFDPNHSPLTYLHTVSPYLALVVLLLAGRFILPSYKINLPGQLHHTLNLFNPGLIFLALAGAYAWQGKLNRKEVHHTARNVAARLQRTAAVIFTLVAGTQILIYSTSNNLGFPGMLAGAEKLIRTENSLILTPLLGALGSFVAGSVTVSNLMFAQIHWEIAAGIGVSGILILSLQLFGATAGNALALANLGALQGVLNLHKKEKQILRSIILPIGLYLSLIVFTGMVALYFI